jgi:N-methylhydantoinase B
MGLRRDYTFESVVEFSVMADRVKCAPEGISGGRQGRASHFVINPDGDAIELPSKFSVELSPGDIISVQTGGGGGHGDPSLRDRGKIEVDLKNDMISREHARAEYGFGDVQ